MPTTTPSPSKQLGTCASARDLLREYALKAARLAHILHMVTKNLLNLHKKRHKEASPIVRKEYTTIIR
jgi:hypothetical protein